MPTLALALAYLEALLRHRLSHDTGSKESVPMPEPPSISEADSMANFLMEHEASIDELVVLTLGLVPHVHPFLIDSIVNEYLPEGSNFPALGGSKGKTHRGFLPTGETAVYLLSGQDWRRRFEIIELFEGGHYFAEKAILKLEDVKSGEPDLSGRILLDTAHVDLFSTGRSRIPVMSGSFPAQYLSTELDWEDLVLDKHTLSQIEELQSWLNHNDTLLHDWGMSRFIKSGYRALFHGPPGTGKTLTATLLGKYTGLHVFRIDLSMVVSKFIGETEKNLSSLFDKARNKNWILFFDEADALFSKRTGVRDAHDKYANQEVSYLLQRIENYPGLTILATNFRSNLDDAFTRRFNSIIHFPMPGPKERLRIWKNYLPPKLSLTEDVDLNAVAEKFNLTGSNIANIVHMLGLEALSEERQAADHSHLFRVIKREMAKEGKPMI
ncbi:MAG: ATP-binding protein [Bacteroidota bacterium]